MLPFLFLVLVPICLQHVKIRRFEYQSKNRTALKLFFLILFLMVALRHENIGNDTRNYHMFFTNADTSAKTYFATEPGFGYLMRFVAFFTNNPQVFIAIIALICIALIAPQYEKMCEDTSLTIVLFCFLSTFPMLFSGLRQMIAIGIGFIAFQFVREKRVLPFALAVLVAVLFHNSGFMLLFMYPLYHARISKKWLYIVVPMMLLAFLFNRQIFLIFSTVLSRFSRFEGSIERTGAYMMIVLLALFSIFSYLVPNEEELDSDVLGMRNFLLASTAIQMFAPLNTLAMRLNYYYIIFVPILLPKIIKHRNVRWSQIALLARHVMVAFFAVYFFVTLAQNNPLHIYPYHFFWENL